MKTLFINYPKCTTCKKAKKWLQDNEIDFTDRHIVEMNPSEEELKTWIEASGLEIKKFFNTSGILYREMKLKDKVKEGNVEELLKILSSDGMLVKRPLLIHNGKAVPGFKEEKWEELLEIKSENIRVELEKNLSQKDNGGVNGKDIVVDILMNSDDPMKSSEIAEVSGLDKKEIDKHIKSLKKEEKIYSPKRCYYHIDK